MPDRYAVIGNPIAHSKSPQIHAEFARQTGQSLTYERLLAPLDGFAATVDRFASEAGLGLNVTVPFKLEAFALAHSSSVRARRAGAVNTLKREGRGWYGDNTDGAGLLRALEHRHSVRVERCHVLVLGAGGAARGVVAPLLEAHPRSLTIANRSVEKAVRIAYDFADLATVGAVSVAGLEGRRFDLVINASSAGLSSATPTEWPGSIFERGAFAYDMLYGDTPTPFLRFAIAEGVDGFADGLGMLIEQAAESFFLWRGVRPDTAPLYDLLRPNR